MKILNISQMVFILLFIIPNLGYSAIIPIIGYLPETRLVLGFSLIYTFHDTEESRQSSIPMTLMYTQNKQYTIGLSPDFYFKDGEYHLQVAGMGFSKYPELFYGIGNSTPEDAQEDLTQEIIFLRPNIQKRLLPGLNAGISYDFERSEMVEVKEDGMLGRNAEPQVPGSQGGINSGIGVLLNWDDRDNVFSAKTGGFYQISSVAYRNFLGSDYEFTQHRLDLRHYFSILPSHTLALQGLLNVTTGDVPFQKLSLLGGENMMRGYYLGRYRDKNMIALQMEYRVIPVWWRIGLVGFLGFGDVSDSMENFRLEDFKYSAGLGLRFQFDLEERINIRVEYAFGKDSSGGYITMMEAF